MNKRVRDIFQIVKEFIRQTEEDAVDAFSARAAFFILLALFPFIMLVLTLIQYLPVSHQELADILYSFMPVGANSYIASIVEETHQQASGTLVSVTALSTLWAASNGVYALMIGIRAVYKFRETRNYIHLKARSVFYTLLIIVMLILTMGIFVFGETIQQWINQKIPVLENATNIILSIRTILGIGILTVFSLFLYIAVPSRKTKAKYELPGALLSAVGWVLFSHLFSFYMNNYGNYTYFYGNLTAVILLMLWLYFCMYIMLIGAELNVFLQKKRFPFL